MHPVVLTIGTCSVDVKVLWRERTVCADHTHRSRCIDTLATESVQSIVLSVF